MRSACAVHARKCTPYDARDPTHEALLVRLWACGFGADVKPQLQSER